MAEVTLSRALFHASRPKTLTATLVPILVGVALAYHDVHTLRAGLLLLILLSAGFIQIGTNFVNDALDFLKGADTIERLGPARAAQQGWLGPKTVLSLGIGCFVLAAICGLPLVMVGGWPILTIGLISLAMGYCYTGGPYPLAYHGLGDLFVLIFFGWVAVGGTYFLMTNTWDWPVFVAGTQIGLLGTVLIAVNNLRDRVLDEKFGKRTLAVRLGQFASWEVTALVTATFALCLFWLWAGVWKAALLPALMLPAAVTLDRRIHATEAGPIYNLFLAKAALLQLGFGVLMAVGFIVS